MTTTAPAPDLYRLTTAAYQSATDLTVGARIVSYTRISSDPTGRRAGVKRQRTENGDLIARGGGTLVHTYEDDDTSAYSGKARDQFDAMIRDGLAGQFAIIVVWAMDRLCRRIGDLADIGDRLGGRVVVLSVTEGAFDLSTADGLMRATQAVMVAQYESKRKSERVRAAVAQRVNAGRVTTAARPFGWSWADPCPGGSGCLHEDENHPACEPGADIRPRSGSKRGLVVNEAEAPAVRHIFAALADGQSIRSVARWLQDNGYTGATGKPFKPRTVRGVATAARHAGLVTHKGNLVHDEAGQRVQSADGLAIVSPDLFLRVQAILDDPERRASPRVGRPAGTLLSGIAVCAKCGGNMNGATQSAPRAAGRQPVYVCGRTFDLTRRRDLLDGPVVDAVAFRLANNAERVLAYATTGQDQDDATRAHQAEVDRLTATLADLTTALATGGLDVSDYTAATKATRARLGVAQAKVQRVAARPALAALMATSDPVAAWLEMAAAEDPEPARVVLREVLDRVVVHPPAVRYHPADDDLTLEGGLGGWPVRA